MSGERDFTYGLCGCFGDCTTCLLAFFCPCIVVGNIAEDVGENKLLCLLGSLIGLFTFPIIYCVIRIILRGKLRDKHNISGGVIKDCLCVTFCDLCALTQEGREAKEPSGQYLARE